MIGSAGRFLIAGVLARAGCSSSDVDRTASETVVPATDEVRSGSVTILVSGMMKSQ